MYDKNYFSQGWRGDITKIDGFWNGISGSNTLSNRADYPYLQPPCSLTDWYVDPNIQLNIAATMTTTTSTPKTTTAKVTTAKTTTLPTTTTKTSTTTVKIAATTTTTKTTIKPTTTLKTTTVKGAATTTKPK